MITIATSAGTMAPAALAEGRRTIPFDYAFRYELQGNPGAVLNDTVTVSVEAHFVAVSIGYGAIPRLSPVIFGVPELPSGPVLASGPRKDVLDVSLGELVNSVRAVLKETERRVREETVAGTVFKNGIRFNPRIADVALASLESGQRGSFDPRLLAQLFQVVSPPPEQIQFLYALFDEGSGREFQSEPILNTAGLGIPNGDRPFRYFPKPIVFTPRSTIRLQITEVSDFQGELHISLQGYKMLGEAGTPTAPGTRRAGRPAPRGRT